MLKAHCDDVGRPYEEIERTALGMVRFGPDGMDPTSLVQQCRSLADIGIQHFIFSIPTAFEITPLKIIGQEVIPEVTRF